MLILMLAAAMSVLATMLTMTAAVVVGFPLIKEVCKQYGYKPGDTFPVMLFVAMFYIADVAFMMLPFKALPAVLFGVYSQLSDGHVINYTAYVGICAIQLVLARSVHAVSVPLHSQAGCFQNCERQCGHELQ